MNSSINCRGLALLLLSAGCHLDGASDRPAPPSMKMTTDVPPGVATPDRIESRLGLLTGIDGVPDEETTQIVFDNLDFQRGVQAFLSTLQIASMEAMREGHLEQGPANETVLLFQELMDSKSIWLTPNTTSVYMSMWLELGYEPMVLETPPNVLGIIDDAYFRYVGDFGNLGADRAQGGKFLIVPPGYQGEIPAEGYFVMHTETYGNWVIWRGFLVDDSPATALAQTRELFRCYPLSHQGTPPVPNFVNMSGVFTNTVHRMDMGYWDEVNATIQREPVDTLEPEILGLLAAIGIEKGEPFEPDERMSTILAEAADVGAVTVRALSARPRDPRNMIYSDGESWTNPFIEGRYTFLEDDNARMLDARAYFHFYATGITPAMAMKIIGKGSQYACAYLDADGQPFDGSANYRVHVPANVPAADFWSFTLYDNQTRSMLQTDQRFPSLDSYADDLKLNADGSCDVYFGPKAPEGMEGNWVQTVPGKGWNMIFRAYGPGPEWFDRSWRLGDPERLR